MVGEADVFLPAEKRVISFGRYKGQLLGSLPSSYLRWVSSQNSLHQQGRWAHLAKQVLRDRCAFEGLAEQDLEKQEQSAQRQSPWTNLHYNVDNFEHPAILASLLRWCGSSNSLLKGRRVHHQLLTSELEQQQCLRRLVVQMYGECAALDDARAVLTAMRPKDALLWNLLMKAYMQHGHGKDIFKLFDEMQREEVVLDRVTILYILTECGNQVLLQDGRLTHFVVVVKDNFWTDVVVRNAIITMYGKCGSPDDALRIFEQMATSDIVTWNAIIGALGRNGLFQMALGLFVQMKQEGIFPVDVTYVSILDACTSSLDLFEGCHIHVNVLAAQVDSNVIVGTALVNMQGKCGQPDNARKSFDRIPRRNAICWTAMIAAYTQNHRGKDALEVFSLMEQAGERPNKVTFISVLDACASSASLALGEELYIRIRNAGFDTDFKVATALINMYARCGRVKDARVIFDKLSARDLATWNAMVGAYAQHGRAGQAFELFSLMKSQGIRPNLITYVSILSMCSRAGLVHEACELFASMELDYGIDRVEQHQNCMIDLLAKAGQLDQAEWLVQDMQCQPSYIPFMTLLGACNTQIDVERAKRMAQLLFRLGKGYGDQAVRMSGIRAVHSVHRIAEASTSEGKFQKKWLGSSSIKVASRLHEFVYGEKSHPLIDDICCELTRLMDEMQKAGHLHLNDSVPFDQYQHTGLLAVGFGLISTSALTPLYITKNTSLCAICHAFVEYVSKVRSRKIFIKDVTRLHRFKGGVCSCVSCWPASKCVSQCPFP